MNCFASSLSIIALSLVSGCACGAQVHFVDASVEDATVDDAMAQDASIEVAPDAITPEHDAAIPEQPAHLIASARATCLLDDATRCWGASTGGGSFGDTPQPAPSFDGVIDVRIGSSFTCALRADGRVACAGSNFAGQLGVAPETVASRETLEVVPGLDDVVEIAIDGAHACARRSDGSVWCWGDNSLGAVGRPVRPRASGASVPEPSPMPVAGVTGAIGIAAGTHHSCAALADGTVACWGYDNFGQLGNGGPAASTHVPTTALEIDDAVAIDARGSSTCALRADGTVWCWGRHSEGQLGIAEGEVETCSVVVGHPCATAPRQVVGVDGARAIAFGGVVGCALVESGARCWGIVAADLADDVVELAVGWEHVCVGTGDERVRCRGRGDEGQLGDGTALDRDEWVDVVL